MEGRAHTESRGEPSLAPRRRMAYEEFLNSSEFQNGHLEWVEGEVIPMGPAGSRHQELVVFLSTLLNLFVQTHSRGKVIVAPFQMKLKDRPSGREPDLLYVSSEHLERLRENHLDGPADIAIEIISPESRARDRGEKYHEYEQAGVGEYWLIDPDRKKAEFYFLGENGTYDLMAPDENGVFRSRVLEGVWLKIEWLWEDPLPTAMAVLKQWGVI